jgi:hypothetical protein
VGTLIDYSDRGIVWRCTHEVADAVVADQKRLRDTERKVLAAHGTSRRCSSTVTSWFSTRRSGAGTAPSIDAARATKAATRSTSAGPGPPSTRPTATASPASFPRLGDQREYVMATHQPLRMPHDRITVTEVHAPPLGDRVDYAATVSLDANLVGTIGHTRAGAVEFHPLSRVFTPADLETFVRTCRWRGRDADTATVVQALVAEYETTRAIASAEARGMVSVVLRDGDDHIVSTGYVLEPRPFAPGDRQTLAELFTGREAALRPGQNQFVWQIWTGGRWQLLGIVDVPNDTTPTEHEVPGADQASTMTGSAGHPP